MKLTRNQLLPDLYNGHHGPHLTAYIPPMNGDISQIREHIDRVIWKSERLLAKEHDSAFVEKFVLPLRSLCNDPALLNGCEQTSWALFRTRTAFRIKKIQGEVPYLSVVASSFHVKPLLKWAQTQQDLYVVACNYNSVTLYRRSRGQLLEVASTDLLPAYFDYRRVEDGGKLLLKHAAILWLEDWVMDRMSNVHAQVLFAGEKELVDPIIAHTHFQGFVARTDSFQFSQLDMNSLHRHVERIMHEIAELELEKSILQLNRAERMGQTEFDMQAIARLAVQDEIKRLYVADDTYIWGELCPRIGTFKLNRYQKNCHDDDILDDLAEIVLKNNAEVVLVPRNQMPMRLPVAAIVRKQSNPVGFFRTWLSQQASAA